MSEEHLPKSFSRYWNIEKELPKTKPVTVSRENLSKDWISFLESISIRIKKDLQPKK